jgi:hypothetical protein
MTDYKSRIMAAFPVFSKLFKNPFIKTAIIAGGAAGNLSVTGIKVGDEISSIISVGGNSQTLATGAAAGDITVTGILADDVLKSVINLTDGTDVTSEFTVTADDTINNTGGTATTGDTLLVVWERPKTDLSSEFMVKSDDVISNTDGTVTTGMTLMVVWIQWAVR